MTVHVFFPTRRCEVRSCRAVFVGIDARCAACDRKQGNPAHATLRGMQCSGLRWPFFSVDSTDVAQNHNRPQNTALGMASRWDAMQCGGPWVLRPQQAELAA